ncbi:MAG: propanediol utilization protein [Candidatus Komeilibacteria bacterium CG_4_10_14_0_2_um_filter_37_10]|uniref:Phosphate propanoyltransferase n=1 Tax=Candidatus Komeilibacteria bacterium CG_4_10_14_0_2_um_filter_37_10 TaxID=1974470 RepID=A0A2M7VE59_9BACT|nr:MAG: propanediol utilization protein [Candidatus Komeilibacteria bacterium CG_4_10_14_0_2_um_filter_37_10]
MKKKLLVPIEISARHVHLCQNDFVRLFGKRQKFKKIKNLSQSGEFVSQQTVDLYHHGYSLKKVRVVGPWREQTQVELSVTDCWHLRIKPVLRLSGELSQTTGILLKYKNKEVVLLRGVIVAKRHWHLSTKLAQQYGLLNKKKVCARVSGERGGIIDNIIIRHADNYHSHIHLDTDEANAWGLLANAKVEIIL